MTITLEDDGKGNLVAPSGSTLKPTEKFTNTFAPAKATLQVTKEFNDWGRADSFTFNLAAVTENAPMPANNTTATATATKDLPQASFGEVTYDKAGTYKYTITEVNGGADGVTYDTTPHEVVVTVTKAEDATNALSATVKYDGDKDSLTVTNTRQFYDVVIDTSMTGGTVTATPASAAAGDTVTLTVTPDKGSELTSLTVTATGAAVTVNPDQNDPNLYSFVMPATGVTVTATFKEILYTVVEGAEGQQWRPVHQGKARPEGRDLLPALQKRRQRGDRRHRSFRGHLRPDSEGLQGRRGQHRDHAA